MVDPMFFCREWQLYHHCFFVFVTLVIDSWFVCSILGFYGTWFVSVGIFWRFLGVLLFLADVEVPWCKVILHIGMGVYSVVGYWFMNIDCSLISYLKLSMLFWRSLGGNGLGIHSIRLISRRLGIPGGGMTIHAQFVEDLVMQAVEVCCRWNAEETLSDVISEGVFRTGYNAMSSLEAISVVL